MAQSNDDVASQQVQSEALRLAGANNLAAAQSVLEVSADAIEVSKRYADFAQALYNERKDVTQMLAVAKAGIRYCLDAAERVASKDAPAANTLKNNAKVVAFNAAANSWPGWGDDGVVIEQSHIEEAIKLAMCSLHLVEDLNLGSDQLGNAYWLVGALHFAGGRSDHAIAALTRARDAFRAGDARASELMALGYLALARDRCRTLERQPAGFEEVCRQLEEEGSPDAMAYIQQLRTAARLL